MVKRSDIVSAAREYIATPFHHQGRAKGVGVDCIGLIVGAAAQAGLVLRDRTDYSRQPVPSDLLRGFRDNFAPINGPDFRPADILVFWVVDPATLPPEKLADTPQHVALATDLGMMHAWNGGARKVVEHGVTKGWLARLHSVWKIQGLED